MKRSELKRTPMKRKPPKHRDATEFSDATKRKARIRADDRCQIEGCRNGIGEFHHRRMKSAGGVGTLVNCLAVCPTHHRTIHDQVAWAYRHGLLVKSYSDPADVPVFAGCNIYCQEDHALQ